MPQEMPHSGREQLLGRGGCGGSFTHHVLVLPLEEAKLWGRIRGVKTTRARAMQTPSGDRRTKRYNEQYVRV